MSLSSPSVPAIPLRDVHGYKPGSEVDPFLPQLSVVVTVTALDSDNDDETMIESLTSKPRSVDYCRLVNQTVFFVRDTHEKDFWAVVEREGPVTPLGTVLAYAEPIFNSGRHS